MKRSYSRQRLGRFGIRDGIEERRKYLCRYATNEHWHVYAGGGCSWRKQFIFDYVYDDRSARAQHRWASQSNPEARSIGGHLGLWPERIREIRGKKGKEQLAEGA